MKTGTSFQFKEPDFDRIAKNLGKALEKEEGLLKKKVQDIVNVVWQTAHAKRPIISKLEMKKSGRSKRVSNPNALSGVPVDTGALQISISKKIEDTGKKIIGTVFVDPNVSNPKGGTVMKYAKSIEFGTSKMRPRSFLRSSMQVNKSWILKRFRQKEATVLGRFSPGK